MMGYCCDRFRDEHIDGFIEEPNEDKNSPYDEDRYWHVAWEWMSLIELKYCPFCGKAINTP